MSFRFGAAATLVGAVLLIGCNQTGKDSSAANLPGAGFMAMVPNVVSPEAASQREAARQATRAGNFADALAIYDRLTDTGSTDIGLYEEANAVARAASDRIRNVLYAERRLKVAPDDWELRVVLPLMHRRNGDFAGFDRTRADLIARWKAANDPQVKKYPFFMTDMFSVAGLGVNVFECYEQAGPLGASYQFVVLVPPNPPRPLITTDTRAVIVLEHNQVTGQIMRQTGSGDGVKPSLDVFTKNSHRLIGFLPKEPTYGELKDMVVRDITANASTWLLPEAGTPPVTNYCATTAMAN